MISGKLAIGIFMLRSLKSTADIKVLMSVYYAYVHSNLQFGLLLWGNHSSAINIFKLQKKAVRITYGASFTEHCKPLFQFM